MDTTIALCNLLGSDRLGRNDEKLNRGTLLRHRRV